MKVLQMIDCAWRATVEEQDDTIVWLSRALNGAGAGLDLLLLGDASAYAVSGQDAGGLAFGEWRQTQPPRIADDLIAMLGQGSHVYVAADDAGDRGLLEADLLTGIEMIPSTQLASLIEDYDAVWRW